MTPSLPGLGPLDGSRARTLLIVVAALTLVGVGANSVRRANQGRSSRYDENVSFSRELVYERLNVYELHSPQASHTKYPPSYFVYVAPFVRLPTGLGAAIWFLLNVCMVIATIVMAVRLAWPVDSARPPPWTTYALLACVTAPVVISNLSTAQVNIQIGFFVVLGLHAIRGGRYGAGGLSLMVATMLKLTPALLLVWLVFRRHWLAVRGAAIGFLALSILVMLVLGTDHAIRATRSWIEVLVPFARDGVLAEGISGVRHTNQSLAAGFFRFFTDIPAGAGIEDFRVNILALSYDTAATVVKALNVILLLAVAWVLGRGPVASDGARFAREAALLMVLMIVISPISWINHHVALILPYALVLQAWREAQPAERPGWRWPIGIAVALMLTSVWVVLLAFSLPLLGAILVGLLLVRLLRQERAATA